MLRLPQGSSTGCCSRRALVAQPAVRTPRRSTQCRFHASSSASQAVTARVRLPTSAPNNTRSLDQQDCYQPQHSGVVEQLSSNSGNQLSQAVTGVTQLPGQDNLDPAAAEVLANWAEAYQLPDEMSLWDDGDYYSSRRDLATAYEPPTSNLPGLASAVGLIAAWACLFKHAIWGFDLFGPLTPWHVLDGVLTFAALEFVSTGLFITTHDSMHGSVTPNNRFLNDVIGATCISLYAWFDYSLMWTKHWEHHNMCGTPNEDPDFHKGDPGLLPWFWHFMKGYISLQQFAKLQGMVFFLGFFGAPIQNMLLFWAGSGLLSAVRLFYFGTFIPHKPRKGADEVMAWAKARSASGPTLVSFLRCFNFDMHWEHHRWPFCPWWDLPRARKIRYQAMGSIDD